MLRCKGCGHSFRESDAGSHTELHISPELAYGETWMACPECGGTDLEKGSSCPLCGDFSQRGLCECCGAHVLKALEKLKNIGKTESAREAILDKINDFLEEQ